MNDLVEGCTHRTPHRHGTALAYKTCGCRCSRCTAAGTRDQKRIVRARAVGQPLTVDPAPVVAHVRLLLRGRTASQIAAEAGLTRHTAEAVMHRRMKPSRESREAIVAAYDRLQYAPPPSGPMAERTRRWAASQRWAPPAAWDNIDNPREQPKGVAWDERRAA